MYDINLTQLLDNLCTSLKELSAAGLHTDSLNAFLKDFEYRPAFFTAEAFKVAISFYGLEPKSSKMILKTHIFHIIFEHADWVNAGNQDILGEIVSQAQVELVPTTEPSTTLQKAYLNALFKCCLRKNDQALCRKTSDYVTQFRSAQEIMERAAFDAWKEAWQGDTIFQVAVYTTANAVLARTKAIDTEPDMNRRLFSSLIRADWKVFERIFMDLCQIKEWPLEDRGLVTSIVYDMSRLYEPSNTSLFGFYKYFLKHMDAFIKKTPGSLTSFLLLAFDRAIVSESWPTRKVGGFDCCHFLNYAWKDVDILFLREQKHQQLLDLMLSFDDENVEKFISVATLPELIEFFDKPALATAHALRYINHISPEIFEALLIQGCFSDKRFAKSDIAANWKPTQADSNLCIVMKLLLQGKVDLYRMMVCMLDGSLPDRARPHVVQLIDKNIIADYIVPKVLSDLKKKKSGDSPTFEELLSVPPQLVMESRAVGQYIGYRLWVEVRDGRFENSQWNPTLWTALLAFRA